MLTRVTHQDTDEIVALACSLHAESYYARLQFSEGRVRALIATCVERDQVYYGKIVRHGGQIIAGLCGCIYPYHMCDGTYAQDIAFYVAKEARCKSVAPIALIRDFVQWGYAKGAEEIMLSTTSGINEDVITAVYERLGFARVGTIFKRGV